MQPGRFGGKERLPYASHERSVGLRALPPGAAGVPRGGDPRGARRVRPGGDRVGVLPAGSRKLESVWKKRSVKPVFADYLDR